MSETKKETKDKEVNKNKYKSIGQMILKHDFEAVYEELCELIKTNEIEKLQKPRENSVFSELDEILFALLDYAVKKAPKSEIIDIEYTGELYPKAKEVVKMLLDLNANPNAIYDDAETPFLKTARTNSIELLELMINHETNPANKNAQDGENKNGIYYAIMNNADQSLDFLIKKCGLNPNEKNFLIYNQTPVFYACKYGAEKCFDVLISENVSLNIYDLNGRRPVDTMLLAYDESSIQNVEPSEEEQKFWKNFMGKVTNKTKEQEFNNPIKNKYKTSF